MESTWGSHQGTSIFFPHREYGVNKSLNSRGRSPIPRWTSTSSNWSRRTTKRRWVRHRRPVKHFFTEYLLPFFFCFTPVSVRPSWYHVSSSVFCFIISEPIIRKKRVPFSLLNRTESQGGASHACCLVKSCTWFFVIGRNLFFLDRSSISIRVSVLYHLDIVSLPPSARRPQLGGPRRFLFLFFPPARAQQRDCIHFKFDLNLWDFSMNTFQLESKLDSPSFLFTGTNRNVEFETIDGIKLIEAL